jgi:TonB family protein
MRLVLPSLMLSLLIACASQPTPAVSYETAHQTYLQGDHKLAAKQLTPLAEAGDIRAEKDLGIIYESGGGGMNPNFTTAARWMQPAAEGGDEEAQFRLGGMYTYGFGVQKDTKAAYRWYRAAAEQGNLHAERIVGDDLIGGFGVPQDAAQGIEWKHKAAQSGDAEAEYELGYIYLTGTGIPAEINPGYFYSPSKIIAPDQVQGLHWAGLAAEQGNRKAQMMLAYDYRMGWSGLPKDETLAQKYFTLAADTPVQTMEELREAIFQTIDSHKVYPKEAVDAHQTGVVRVTFIAADRKVTAYNIDKSSGYPALDQAAKQALADCTFPPRASTVPKIERFTVDLKFDLGVQAAPAAGTSGSHSQP